jgi:hypothetical protein
VQNRQANFIARRIDPGRGCRNLFVHDFVIAWIAADDTNETASPGTASECSITRRRRCIAKPRCRGCGPMRPSQMDVASTTCSLAKARSAWRSAMRDRAYTTPAADRWTRRRSSRSAASGRRLSVSTGRLACPQPPSSSRHGRAGRRRRCRLRARLAHPAAGGGAHKGRCTRGERANAASSARARERRRPVPPRAAGSEAVEHAAQQGAHRAAAGVPRDAVAGRNASAIRHALSVNSGAWGEAERGSSARTAAGRTGALEGRRIRPRTSRPAAAHRLLGRSVSAPKRVLIPRTRMSPRCAARRCAAPPPAPRR